MATNPALDHKVGFDIGWDYAHYWDHVPSSLSRHKSIVDGFDEAKSRRCKALQADRYIRKWLLLRCNAWRRGRMFDESVTPDYLRFIDAKKCPVTGVDLTYGSRTGSDWSVDRINNDAGYIAGNIVVVSSRANVMKNNYSFADMMNFAYNPESVLPTADGVADMTPLSRMEWGRWALIASHAIVNVDEDSQSLICVPAPCIIQPPAGCIGNPQATMQILIALKAAGQDGGVYKRVSTIVPKTNRKDLHDIVRYAEKLNFRQNPLDAWTNKRLFNATVDLMKSVDFGVMIQAHEAFIKSGTWYVDSIPLSQNLANWGVMDGGYAKRSPSM